MISYPENIVNLQKIPNKMAQYVQRETYLRQLIDRKDNGEVKIITGPRRCGKSSKATSITRVSRNTMPLISASGMLSSTSANKR